MAADGIFGGAGRGQGRKPKPSSAGEDVAELAAQEAPAIRRAYADGLRSRNERTRMVAADKLLAAERAERLRRAEDPTLDELLPDVDEAARMPLEELFAMLQVAFERMPRMKALMELHGERCEQEKRGDVIDSPVAVEAA